MSARRDAIDRLAWLLNAAAVSGEDNPDWVYAEWPVADWAKVPAAEADAMRAIASRMVKTAGLVALDDVLHVLRDRATLLRNNANDTSHSIDIRRRYVHTAEVLGQLANQLERGPRR